MKTGRTIKERRALYSELSKMLDQWLKMTDLELFQEMKQKFPAVMESSREECIKFLVMTHVEKMIGD